MLGSGTDPEAAKFQATSFQRSLQENNLVNFGGTCLRWLCFVHPGNGFRCRVWLWSEKEGGILEGFVVPTVENTLITQISISRCGDLIL
jgi:hypothetical protein